MSNANKKPESESFSFAVTTDIHHHFGVRSEDATGFGDACKKISELGPGSFMISAGDILDVGGVRGIIDRCVGKDYPWYFVIGGHDLENPKTLEYARAYNQKLPNIVNPGPANAPETTYSFDYGNCHFAILNQYFDGKTEAGQVESHLCDALLEWLSDDLDRTEKQHVFAFAHEPAFRHPDISWSNEQAGGGYIGFQDYGLRDRFWDILRGRGALAYIHGHHHVYNRARVRGVWDIEAGRCHSVAGGNGGDDKKPGTFLMVHVDGNEVSYDCYRGGAGGAAFGLCERVVLASGEKGRPPIAMACGPIEVVDTDGDGEEEINLDGSASKDPEGSIMSYSWKREGVKLADGDPATIRLPVGYYRDVSLTVTNESGVTDRDVFYIWVKPQSFTGTLPVVVAGIDQEIALGESAVLEGRVSHDGKSIPEGKLKTQWAKLEGSGVV